MFIEKLGGAFDNSFYYLWSGIASFVPYLLVAIIVFIVGWVVASVVGKLISQFVTLIKLDSLFESAGADALMAKAGMSLNVPAFFGGIVKWAIIIIFMMASLQFLGLSEVTSFFGGKVLMYLGNVLIAVLILVIGFVIADVVKSVVTASAKAVNVSAADFVGSIARYAVIVFAFAIALPKLLLLDGDTFLNLLFSLVQPVIWMLALAGAISFGLGGKEAAGRAIDKFTKGISNK